MTTERENVNEVGLLIAEAIAKRGTCLRRQVGCYLVDEDGKELALGYNGVARGMPHCNQPGLLPYPNACAGALEPSGTGLDKCDAIHAEANALLKCANVRAIHTCYVTVSPCRDCTKLLMNTGCIRIIFRERYPHLDAEEMWLKSLVQGYGPTREYPRKWIQRSSVK